MATFPDNSWDTHVHVFDHALFPYKPDRQYTPESSTLESLVEASKCQNFVLVQASFESGPDGILHHLRRASELYPDRQFRGEIFWDERAEKYGIDKLHQLGVRCLRLHGEYGNRSGVSGDLSPDEWALRELRALRNVATPMGWAVAAQLPMELWINIIPSLESGEPGNCVAFIAEHFGSPPPAPFSQAQVARLEEFVNHLHSEGAFYVKLSALHRRFLPSASLDSLTPLITMLASRAPHALLYGSDFPHVDVTVKGLEPGKLLPVEHRLEAHVMQLSMHEQTWWKMVVDNPLKIFS